MVIGYLREYEEANRQDIDRLIRDKLSDALSENQKTNFIKNLIQELRHEGFIEKRGAETGEAARWVLSKSAKKADS